jgi:purine/pyrimidine-nucleoside phosphorylase
MSFKGVEVKKQANVFHNGRVTSRTVITVSGQRKTLGIMLPGTYRFTPDVPERIDVTQGKCKVRIAGGAPSEYAAGASFEVPPKKEFEIEVLELLDYVCHFG